MTNNLHRMRRCDGNLVDRIRNLVVFAALTPRNKETILIGNYLMSVAFQGELGWKVTPCLGTSGRVHSLKSNINQQREPSHIEEIVLLEVIYNIRLLY